MIVIFLVFIFLLLFVLIQTSPKRVEEFEVVFPTESQKCSENNNNKQIEVLFDLHYVGNTV